MKKGLSESIADGINATREGEYLAAINHFVDAYGDEELTLSSARTAEGLSFYGLCLALVQRKYKVAIDLCKRAIEMQFYGADHYANLARVYIAASMRKKAVETVEEGLRILPNDEVLLLLRKELGVRSRPVVPFLDRKNPINRSLGQSRHVRKGPEEPPKKKS